MFELIPAVLEKTPETLQKKVAQLPDSLNFIHIDVLEEDVWPLDDWNVPKFFEAHLMVEHPEAIMKRWVERGAKRIIVHKLSEDVLKYRGQVEIGLAFELSTPIEDVLNLANLADFVHIMSIAEIGEQGHPLDERIFDRIRQVQDKFPNLVISVDGGITSLNYHKLVEAGADRLVVGSHFQELWNSLKKN